MRGLTVSIYYNSDRREWIAVTGHYDGADDSADNQLGSGSTQREAVDDLFEQLENVSDNKKGITMSQSAKTGLLFTYHDRAQIQASIAVRRKTMRDVISDVNRSDRVKARRAIGRNKSAGIR